MIKYISHTEIDKDLWDRRITASPQGKVYAFSWFLDIVSPGWEALVTDDYQKIFPLTNRKRAGISYLFQPYFTQQLGLFSSSEKIEEEELNEFLNAIPKKFRLIEIQLNTGNILNRSDRFQIYPRKTHLLNLSGKIENIRSGYSENLRRNLKKANTSETILGNCTIEEVIELFRNNRGKDVENLKDKDYRVFKILMDSAKEKNNLEIISVNDLNGSLLAAATFIRSVHSYIFLFSSTTDPGKNTGAMSRIIDSFIASHCSADTMLDFEGSMDENLARFYKSFGSKEVVYLQIRQNNLPSLIRWLK